MKPIHKFFQINPSWACVQLIKGALSLEDSCPSLDKSEEGKGGKDDQGSCPRFKRLECFATRAKFQYKVQLKELRPSVQVKSRIACPLPFHSAGTDGGFQVTRNKLLPILETNSLIR